jgi:hypothetical protein
MITKCNALKGILNREEEEMKIHKRGAVINKDSVFLSNP